MGSLFKAISEKLRAGLAAAPELEGVALVSPEGLLMAQEGRIRVEDQDILAGVLSSAIGFGSTIARQLGIGENMTRGIVEAPGGIVAFTSLADGYLLALVAAPNVKLGILFMVLRQLRDELSVLLSAAEVGFNG